MKREIYEKLVQCLKYREIIKILKPQEYVSFQGYLKIDTDLLIKEYSS